LDTKLWQALCWKGILKFHFLRSPWHGNKSGNTAVIKVRKDGGLDYSAGKRDGERRETKAHLGEEERIPGCITWVGRSIIYRGS
jgi:hypothetical protein